jgi:hypothetical protein
MDTMSQSLTAVAKEAVVNELEAGSMYSAAAQAPAALAHEPHGWPGMRM